MPHIHEVLDADKHFIIDPCTGELVNYTPEKNSVRQFAHNSERLTFELPRIIEGHDMSTCNIVEVHFINIDAVTGTKNHGLYPVKDLAPAANGDGEETVKCSWLISKEATQLAGPLLFRLNFICSTNGNIDYLWPTAICRDFSVADGINNTGYVVDAYPDVLVDFNDRLRDLEAGCGNVDLSSYVKTVNGVGPDANGNVNTSGSDSGQNAGFDPTAYGLPVIALTGDISPIRVSKDNKVTCEYVYGERTGTCTMKGQGSSSYNTAHGLGDKGKFNYTITFDEAFEAKEGWGEQKKYCLKANTIDPTHVRNIVGARLWGQIVASRTPKDTTLAACPNYGAIDGFPVVITLNGEFHGLYTMNIPKDMWMFNMGSGTHEAIICANYGTPAVDLRVHAAIDESDFELEEVTDENNAGWVADSLNNIIDLCVNSYGADLDTTIAQCMDWESAIDYNIFTVVLDGRDMYKKNYILVWYDPVKLRWSAYDMDSIFGMQWDSKAVLPANAGVSFNELRRNRVMELIYRFKTNRFKERYWELRKTVLSEENLNVMVENLAHAIPSVLYSEDVRRWPAAIHGSSVFTVDQILRWLHRRLPIVDKWVEELPAQETPVAPADRVGNVVPESIAKNGSVFNGTGYKDGYTIEISSDGVESEVEMAGCCITGYIPFTKDNIAKITTDGWNISPTNSRIMFYNSSFEPMAFYTQHGYVGMFNGYTYKTCIKWKNEQSVTYGTDGMTTLNIAYGENCTDLAYIRIRAVGNGANLAVIREGEVPDHVIPDSPDAPGYTNLVPTSTDVDGAVFNGTGYQDGYCLTYADAGVTLTELSDHTTDGFIPVTYTDVIRMAGVTWGATNKNVISFYDENKKPLGCYLGNGYVITAQPEHTSDGRMSSILQPKELQSVTTDNGVATFNMVFWEKDQILDSGARNHHGSDVKYVRISAEGSGANMIVTVNEEIV